jgi:hypothetical protein
MDTVNRAVRQRPGLPVLLAEAMQAAARGTGPGAGWPRAAHLCRPSTAPARMLSNRGEDAATCASA